MKRQTVLAVLSAVLAFAVLASAQTVDLMIARGFLQVRGTANNALSVVGGITAPRIQTSGANPLFYSQETDGPANEQKWRWLGFSGDLYLQTESDDGLTVNTALQITRTGAATGQLLVPDGTAGAPAIALMNDTDTGFYRNGSGFLAVAVGGLNVASISQGYFALDDRARGLGASGGYIYVGRNTSGTGAPAALYLTDGGGANRSLWVDTTGVLRIGGTTLPVEGGSDTIGTVVGTQTSTRASKDILRRVTETALAMQTIRDTPVYEFRYKSGAYNSETFTGIVTDDSPMFGMDQGKSFNPVSAFGASVLALQDLDARVRELEARLRSLEARR